MKTVEILAVAVKEQKEPDFMNELSEIYKIRFFFIQN